MELPLSKLCAVPFALQNRALFKGEKRANLCREKGRKRGGQERGQKGKKNARKQVRVVCNFYAEALFCALLHCFALFCGLAFVLFCALLCAFACFCERPRLERPCLGTEDVRGAPPYLGNRECVVSGAGSQELASCMFFVRISVIARELLVEFDTSVATATSVWRAGQLLREHPPGNTRDSNFPTVALQGVAMRKRVPTTGVKSKKVST